MNLGGVDVPCGVAVQTGFSDGKPRLVVAGDTDGHFAVARLLNTGALDATFGDDDPAHPGQKLGYTVTSITASPTYGTNVHAAYAMGLTPAGGSLPAGEVYVGGTVAGLGGWAGMGVARFTRDGQLDTTFGGGTGTPGLAVYQTFANNDTANALAVQPDGKVVLGGYTNGAETVARFTAAGTLDASFDAAGATPGVLRLADEGYGGNYGRAVALQPDGKVLLTGTGSVGTGFEAVRLNADGTLDNTFGSGGRVAIDVGAASSDPSDAYGAEGDGGTPAACRGRTCWATTRSWRSGPTGRSPWWRRPGPRCRGCTPAGSPASRSCGSTPATSSR